MIHDNVPLLQCFVKKDGRVSYNVATYTLAVIIMVTIELLAESKCYCTCTCWPESDVFTYSNMIVTNVSVAEAKKFTIRMFKVIDNVRLIHVQ